MLGNYNFPSAGGVFDFSQMLIMLNILTLTDSLALRLTNLIADS
jgi:hypothetical protein